MIKINNIKSQSTRLEKSETKDNVILFTQFYIDKDKERQKEIVECLRNNLENNLINKIYLLNERIYSEDEINIINNKYISKIKQVNIGDRIKYKDIFSYVEDNNINGYIIIANVDIYFDRSLVLLYRSGLVTSKKMYCQLRHDINDINDINLRQMNFNMNKCRSSSRPYKLHTNKAGSQDAWIYHSNYNIKKSDYKLFDCQLGIRGCDNHIAYIFHKLGYILHNEPLLIKIYHNHKSHLRTKNYLETIINEPYLFVYPVIN